MQAILKWFGGYLLATVAGEIFRKATIFLTFNIILQFLLGYITSNTGGGISIFGAGASVTDALSEFVTPGVSYVLDAFYVIPGLFMVLNAYLTRFAYRLTIRSVTGG